MKPNYNRIKNLLRDSSHTYKEMVELAKQRGEKLSKPNIDKIVRGDEIDLRVSTLSALCCVLDVSLDEIIDQGSKITALMCLNRPQLQMQN